MSYKGHVVYALQAVGPLVPREYINEHALSTLIVE